MATAVTALRCTQSILSSRVDHRCDRIADFVMMYPENRLPRCIEHMVQLLMVASVGVIVMNAKVYRAWLGAELKMMEN